MFWTRLISGIVLIILAVITLWFGGYVTGVVTMLLSLIGVFELMRVYKVEQKIPGIIAYIWTVLYYVILMAGRKEFIMPVLVTYMLMVLAIYVFTYSKDSALIRNASSSRFVIFFPFLLFFLLGIYIIVIEV